MEKRVNFVIVILFVKGTFCESNHRVDHLEGCRPITEKDELKFVNCHDVDIKRVAKIIAKQTNVTSIDISNSGFQSIDTIDLRQNGKLKKVIASNNKLRKFPIECFRKAPSIEEIDLSSNQLTQIQLIKFEGNLNFTHINLSSNEIDSFHGIIDLSALKHLKCVDLSRNRFFTLYHIPVCSECVVSLHLEDNSSFQLYSEIFPLKPNVSVYFSWDQIRYINFEAQIDRFRVTLDDKIDAILAIPDENSQHEIHCSEQRIKNIQSLHLGKNQVENLSTLLQCFGSSVETLHLSGNNLGKLNRTVFERFVNLIDLQITNTQLVEFDFSMITDKMEQLHISNNEIPTISNVSKLKKFTMLTYFDATECHIQNTPEMIQSLPNSRLGFLNLAGNYIGSLNRTTFDHLTSVGLLGLSNTQITIADFNPFERFPQLLALDISYNNFKTFDFAVIAVTLNKLGNFIASNCQIQNVSDVIQHLGNDITQLDLSGNYAHSLNPNLFALFTNLIALNLSHSNIKHFAPETVQYLINIKIFDIFHNQLREFDCSLIPSGIFDLYFNNNRLLKIMNLKREIFLFPNKLDVADNCFTAEYVMQIRDNLTGINFLTDPFQQKSKEECTARDKQITHSNGDQTWIIITVAVSVVILVVAYVGFVYRKKSCGKEKSALETIKTNITKSNTSESITTIEVTTPNEPIYEELDKLPYVQYDELWHEFQPMPLSKQTRETYNTTTINAKSTDGV